MNLDIHGCNKYIALKYIQKAVIECYKNNINKLTIIHGFNNGSILLNFISNKENLHCKHIDFIEADNSNRGRTIIWIK